MAEYATVDKGRNHRQTRIIDPRIQKVQQLSHDAAYFWKTLLTRCGLINYAKMLILRTAWAVNACFRFKMKWKYE